VQTVQGHGLQLLKRIMVVNVILGVLAYRDLLTFQPRMYTVGTTLTRDAEQVLFTPTETAPLIIVLLSLWLLFHRRNELFALPRRGGPVWLAAPLLGIGSAIFIWAVYTRSPDIQALSLIANLVGCAILWRGLPAVRVAAVPLFLLIFAVPLPSPLIAIWIWQFQLATAVLAGWLLYLIGIPVVVSAEIIRLPMDTYQVIESCSGLRSVETLAMFSILMASLFDRGKLHTLSLFALSIPIAFLMNGLRVVTLILNPQSKIHTIHVAQGLVVLMCGLVLLYLVDGLLPRIIGDARKDAKPRVVSDSAVDGGELGDSSVRQRALAVTCLALVLIGALYLVPVWVFHGKSAAQVDETFAQVVDRGWESEELPTKTLQHLKVSFRETHLRRYSRSPATPGSRVPERGSAEPPIEVFVGVGEHLDRFRTPFSPKSAFPGRGWVTEDMGRVSLEGTEGEITWRLVRSGTERAISYHWMEQDRGLLEESMRSFLALDRSPFARALPVMVVRISTEIEELSPAEISRAHDRLAEIQGLVATAIGVMQERLRAAEPAKTASLLIFPLWESFFPIRDALHVQNTNKISYLRCFRAVA
jgi:exosortase